MTNEADAANRAHEYREGFVEGTRALLKAIGDDLSEEHRRVLEKWISGPLGDWKDAGVDAPPPQLPLIDGA